MGFAALGNNQHNPWFILLIYKVLQGCAPPMIDLLDEPSLATDNERLPSVRANTTLLVSIQNAVDKSEATAIFYRTRIVTSGEFAHQRERIFALFGFLDKL